jgi:hypothetical protein
MDEACTGSMKASSSLWCMPPCQAMQESARGTCVHLGAGVLPAGAKDTDTRGPITPPLPRPILQCSFYWLAPRSAVPEHGYSPPLHRAALTPPC